MKYSFRAWLALLMISVVVLAACTEDDPDDQPSPTPPAIGNVTPSVSPVSGVSSPTPLPTIGIGFVTPTRLSQSGNNPPPQIPTSIANVPTQPFQNAIALTSPTNGSLLRGSIAATGSASHPNFIQYALEYGPDPNPGNLWYPITTVPITSAVINGILGGWNTTTVADGNYQMRLHVWLNNGTEETRTVTGLQVRNQQVATRPPNSNPLIAPIAPISLTRGNSVTIPLGMSDVDNDPLTYIAQVANPGIATVAPAGSAAITIVGVTAGTTTVSVTVSDQRGGSANTSFSVTVVNPPTTNNPPSLAPIPSQTLNTGTSITVSVVAADPDAGDTISLSASSAATGVASVSLSGNTLTITGNSQGSAGITVTATDNRGLSTTVAFLATVTTPAPANNPPVVSAISNQSVTAGSTLDVPMTITDPNNDVLAITAGSNNNGIATAQIVNNSTVRLAGVAAGTASVTITANDNKGGIATTTFNVTVSAAVPSNQPPTIQSISGQTVNAGATVNVNVTTSDPDGNPVTITALTADNAIATVSASGNTLTITGVSQGTTNVTVNASDGTAAVETSFQIAVNPTPNDAPTVDGISDASVDAGSSTDITINASDPDGDTLNLSATSADPSIAVASINGNTVTVSGIGAGSTQITISVSDGQDSADTSFAVTVNAVAPPNTAPTLDAIPDVALNVGDSTTVTVTTGDVDGDSISVTAASDNEGIATVSVSGNDLNISAVGAGQAQITVSASDGTDSIEDAFIVTVSAVVNNPPTINTIGDVTLNQGESTTVTAVTSDPEGDPVTVTASSSDPGVANVSVAGNDITVTGGNAGSASVTVSASDAGGSADTLFNVTVNAAINNPPSIDPIADVNLNAGDSTTVTAFVNDAESDPITLNATSGDPSIASVSVTGSDLNISANAEGSTQITVVANDGNSDSAPVLVNVIVTAVAPPLFDVTVYPEIPGVDFGAMSGIYNDGVNNKGKRNSVFSVAGDDPVNSGDFLPAPLYNFGSINLQGLVDFYNVTAAHESQADPATSFGVQSAATGNGWTIENLFDPGSAPGYCGGQAPLECELNTSLPSVIIVSFSAGNATRTDPDTFRARLQQVVETSLSAGTIPVLATLPNDGSVSPETLAQYNQIIVEVATNPSYNVPLWNLYNTLQNTNPGIGGGGASDLSDGALSSAVNARNLAALRVLDAIKSTLGF